jgi:hypothetical protein
MLQPSGQLFTQALNALLFAVFAGLVIGLWREPARSASVLRSKPAATAGALKPAPTAASRLKQIATKPTDPPFEIKCGVGLASCRKWIALQKTKGRLPVGSAQR